MRDFQVVGLAQSVLQHLQGFSDAELAELGAVWLPVVSNPGFPCRVSLVDATLGERVLAFHYQHLDVATPYRASGPIFIREHAQSARPSRNAIPQFLQHRQLSVRAYSAQHVMLTAAVAPGSELAANIERLLAIAEVAYLHIHNAAPGCFLCAVERA